MSCWRLHLVGMLVAGIVGGLTAYGVAAAWHMPDAAWLRLYDMLPDGCTPIRMFIAFNRETGEPQHEAMLVVCPDELYEQLSIGGRHRP